MEILFEDNHIIVVTKPQNVPTQEDESGDKDLLSMVKEYIKEKYNKPGNVFVGLVHRLDRPTGGVMVFAKNSKAAGRLSEQIKSHEFEKTYFAVVCGEPREKQGHLTHYLKKNEKTNMVDIVPMFTEGARQAEMDYRVLETNAGYSLVKINLITGRSHQARVQMKSLKTPIYGDVKYGNPGAKKGLINLFAVEIVFYHPVSRTRMIFKAYPPEDFQKWNMFNLEKYLVVK